MGATDAVHINITLPDGRETAIAFVLPEQAPTGTVYVVGRLRGGTVDILGVFTRRELADAACTTEEDFVGPMVLDQRDTDETHPWSGQYYPRR